MALSGSKQRVSGHSKKAQYGVFTGYVVALSGIVLGIVLIVNMEIAFLTPPIGLNLFVLSSISRAPLSEAVRGIWPFTLLMAAFLLLVTYVPGIALWLPNAIYGP